MSRSLGVHDEPDIAGRCRGDAAIVAEGDEQPLDTVGAVGGVQQIAPQADEHVAVVGEALDVDAMDRGVNRWIVLKTVEDGTGTI